MPSVSGIRVSPMKSNSTGLTYAQSGVDIDAGNKLIEILNLLSAKHRGLALFLV